MLKKLTIITLATLLTLGEALAAPPVGAGAMVEGRLQQRLDRVAQTPALVAEPVTIILEADSLSNSDVSPHAGTLRYRYGRLHEVSIPGGKLAALLAHLPNNVLARLPYHHEPVAITGQGVAKTGAADMQSMGDSGAGVKMGIIDLGFIGLSGAITAGELPSNMVTTDYTGMGLQTKYDHGTNVAQIAHEMAPGATLYLAKIATETQLAQAANDMAAAGVKVINHSVAWYGAAFYDGTGTICDITNTAYNQGALWMNAMGNARTAHYLGTFTDADANLRHEFAAGQNYNTISLTANTEVSLILNWNAYPTTTTDYNLYLYASNPDTGSPTSVASSAAAQIGTQNSQPYEQITYTPTTTGTYYIVVKKKKSSTPNLPLTLFSTGPNLGKYTTTSSILQPADCANVVGVGAVNLSDAAEWFSSEGPTTDGRAKPEISAPDGVKTSLSSAFYGTSGSSPHATGTAALLLAKNPAMTPAQLRTALVAAVKDVGTAGYDYRTGSGRISLDADADGLNHDDELAYATSPTNPDTDGDGLTDYEEARVYSTSPTNADTDNDGLSDWQEIRTYTTQATNADTDADGLADGLEVNTWHTSPLNADTDGDGLKDGEEVNIYASSPTVQDTDADGLTDFEEARVYSTSPTNADTDNDGLTDWQEIRTYATQATNADTDADGLADGLEVNTWHTSPLNADTDGDGLTDGEEVNLYATSPTAQDTDGDGLTDWQEVKVYFTNPTTSNKADIAPRGAPNGMVDIADLLILTRFTGGLDVPTVQEKILADMNNDGVLDVRDILLLRQQLGF